MVSEVLKITSNPFLRRIEYIIDNQTLGYLEYSLIYDRIEIDDIYVNIKNRHQGIGTKLMAYLVSQAINLRVINITLEVNKNNFGAIRLYHKFGFSEVAIRKNYYQNEDAILMEKQVM